MSEKVFVYGTLKRGYGNHSVMVRSQGKFLGEAVTDPVFSMYDNGAYPAILKDGITPITGEVYEVDHLSFLDGLEGYPAYYNRELIPTKYGDAWIYFLPNSDLSDYWKPIDSGVWR